MCLVGVILILIFLVLLFLIIIAVILKKAGKVFSHGNIDLRW